MLPNSTFQRTPDGAADRQRYWSMHPFLRTATAAELAFVAGLDYGQDKEKHLAELSKLVHGLLYQLSAEQAALLAKAYAADH